MIRKTYTLDYTCKQRGPAKYHLEKDGNDLYFVTTISGLIYRKNYGYSYLNSAYKENHSTSIKSDYDPMNDIYTINIPIISDPVSLTDFVSHEDTQVVLPGHGATLTDYLNGHTMKYPGTTEFTSKSCQHTETYVYTGLKETNTFCKKCEMKVPNS